MHDKVFIDTNVILYAYSVDEPTKKTVAISIIEKFSSTSIISIQVTNELSNILLKKFKLSNDKVVDTLWEMDDIFDIVPFSVKTQRRALKLRDKYNLQYYDSLIIATAIENECTILYSEDMQDGLIIEDTLKIINPFSKV